MYTVLIVDDDKNACEVLSQALERESYKTVRAHSGIEALKQYETAKPDLILLDVMIPDKDGYEVCKEVRKYSETPIIMLTAKDDMLEKILGLELGADDYITKPYDLKEVLARVKAILRRTRNAKKAPEKEAKVIEYDKFIIDMNRYELRLDGAACKAPPKELELLFYLASNPNKVFTRDQLLDDVWGFEYYGDSRTVDVHIKRLRTKLEDVSEKWALKTIWGVGYKFETL